MSRPRRPALFQNIALLSATLAITLGLSEVALRVIRPSGAGLMIQPAIYQADPEIGYRYRPGAEGTQLRNNEIRNAVRINSWGLHDIEPELEESRPRIVAIGDSFTAGLSTPVEQTWPRLLEHELAMRAPEARYQVLNLGLDGTGPREQIGLLEAFLPRTKPVLVLVGFFANDLEDASRPVMTRTSYRGFVLKFQHETQRSAMAKQVDRHLERRRLIWLHRSSHIVRVLFRVTRGRNDLFRTNFLKPDLIGDSVPFEARSIGLARLGASFARLRQLASQHGFAVIVLPVPALDEPTGSRTLLDELVWPTGLQRYDPLPEMRAAAQGNLESLYWRTDPHMNAKGNAAFARASAAAVLRERAR